MAPVGIICPVCGGNEVVDVLSLADLPVAINAQTTPELAPDVPKGDMNLVVCQSCAHLFNASFDPELSDYDASYENTLHFSPHFQRHATELADRLVADFELAGATVAEAGSGPGHFLTMLVEAGAGAANGFDPSYDPERLGAPEHPDVQLSSDLYPDDGSLNPRLALTQHVLEHLTDPVGLLGTLRGSVAADEKGAVYSEVPNGEVMIDRCALWDLIYEHYSYFTTASLSLALTRAGLSTDRVETMFDDQFLAIESRPAEPEPGAELDADAVEALVARAVAFGDTARKQIEAAKGDLARYRAAGPVALWGAGSKGMTYLNLVAPGGEIDAVVDVNPRKAGFGVPGVGVAISGPESLREIQPATVLIANPIYADEIRGTLAELGVSAEVLPLWE
ncbi:MAG: methyltransferase domain-containing protein [Actinomycetota bacterium]